MPLKVTLSCITLEHEGETMVRDQHIRRRVEKEFRQAVERAAANEGRTISNLIEKIVGDWLRARGYFDD